MDIFQHIHVMIWQIHLHEAFGFRTDYEIVTVLKQMKKNFKRYKKLKNITHFF